MSQRTRFVLITIVLVLLIVAAAFFSQCRRTSNPRGAKLNRPLVVGLTSWPGYIGGLVANGGFTSSRESIYFKKYGLDVRFVLIEDVDARGKAFAKGGPDGLDIAWSTVDFLANEGPNLIKNGIQPRAIMQVDWSEGGDAIVAGENIHSLQDLKGKRISLVQFTPSDWFLENVLQKSGLSADDQAAIRRSLVFAQDITAARQAFVANEVDAAVVWEPEVSQAIKRRPGSHVLTSSAEWKNLIADVMLAREEFIQGYPDTIQAFIQGWFDGVAEARAHPDSAVRLLMQEELLFRDLGLDATTQSLKWVKLADLQDNVQMFGLDGSPPLFDTLFSRASTIWVARGYVSEALAPAQVKDDRTLRLIYGKR